MKKRADHLLLIGNTSPPHVLGNLPMDYKSSIATTTQKFPMPVIRERGEW